MPYYPVCDNCRESWGGGFSEAIRRSLPRSSGLTGKRKMKLAIIEAIGLAAMFIIAAAVSYNSGYVGGRVDGLAEQNSAIRTTEGGAK